MKINYAISFICLGFLSSYVAFGQGTFEFLNYNATYGVDAPVFDAHGFRLQGADYGVELYGGTSPDSLAPALSYGAGSGSRVVGMFYTGNGAGYFFHQTVVSVEIPSVAPFALAALQVRAWDARLGNTYEDVVALGMGGYGASPIFYAAGGSSGPNPTLAGPLIGLQSFSLQPIPEPAIWQLSLIGTSAILLFRRK